MSKTVVMFAGQGSQYKNMGLDFLENGSEGKIIFEIAQSNLLFNIIDTLKSDLINQTLYTQPLILLTSIIIYSEVKKHIKPDAFLGFSLGEYTAFYEAGIFNLIDTLNIVQQRSLLMSEASKLNKGSMQAIIGLKAEAIKEICLKISKPNFEVSIANYNEPGQIVISGNEKAVEEVAKNCLKFGARRVIPLNVSGAFHTKYMSKAGRELEEYIKQKTFISKPIYPIWLNATGKELTNESISEVAKMQVQSPVLFNQSIIDLINHGFKTFIEIGPGKVLSGLVKKINKDVKVINISKYEDLEKLKR